jgi:hypothetical protein
MRFGGMNFLGLNVMIWLGRTGDLESMITSLRRSRTSSVPSLPATVTTTPHPEWTLTPIAAGFIASTLLPEFQLG